MNEDDVKEFLTVCLMCGESVPTKTLDGEEDDLAYLWLTNPTPLRGAITERWGMWGYCKDHGYLGPVEEDSSGRTVRRVTQKGKDLLL